MILAPRARIDEYTARGWWGTRRIHDWFSDAVREHPERVALADPPNRREVTDGEPQALTWREVDRAVARMATAFLDFGLQRDDVVCVQLPNCVELALVYLACLRLGLIASPVPVQYREHELRHILALSQARVFLTTARVARHRNAQMALDLQRSCALPAGFRVLAFGDDIPEGAVAMGELLACAPDDARLERLEREQPVDANDVFTLCWTSGTESVPKGVPRSHNEWLSVPENMIVSAGLQPGSRLLNPFPMVNMAGIGGLFLPWLMTGGRLVMHHPFNLQVYLQQIRDEAIDYTIAAPAILNQLAQDAALPGGIDLGVLRAIGSGGGPLSEWTVRALGERHGLQVINYFGSNEGASLTASPLDLPDALLRARYFPRFGAAGFEWKLPVSRRVRTRLVAIDDGRDIEDAGRPGELRVRGPAIFSGYWRAPDLTRNAFDEQGYFRTGDLFEIAGEWRELYRFVGRAKDIIVRGGFNISAEELELLLAGHPKVAEVAIVGYPDALLGERVCACVVPGRGASVGLAELVDFLRRDKQVAAYKLPERIELLEALPRNALAKVLKRELRARLLERAAQTLGG